MTSLEAKHRLMGYLNQFGGRYTGAVYEAANLANADVLAVKYDGTIAEYEIKVSKADLRGELAAIRAAQLPSTIEQVPMFPLMPEELRTGYFAGTKETVRKDVKLSHTKIKKHHHYLVAKHNDEYNGRELFYPNTFYFAVPAELVQQAIEGVDGLPYGVFNLSNMSVERPARSFRKEPHPTSTYRHLFNRACTQRRDVQAAVRRQNTRLIERIASELGLMVGTPGRRKLEHILAEHQAAEGLDNSNINEDS